ncbi:MAG: hypothetical protein ACI7YS_07825 [Flavobacterium sp.]
MKLYYYKNILSYAFFVFFVIGCNGQKDNKSVKDTIINSKYKKDTVMKKLDKVKLEKYKTENQFKYTENDTVFKLEDQGENYKEIKNKIGERLKTINIYDKSKLVLIGEGKYLFDFPIGIYKEYDLKGNVVKERNFDEDFPFTFQDLKQKLLNESHVNIENTDVDIDINRGLDTSDMKYKYYLTLYNEDRSSYRYILIDGATGNTIKDLNVRALD